MNNTNRTAAPASVRQEKPASSDNKKAFMSTKFSLAKFIILSVITCGIYSLFVYANVGTTLDLIASRHDGKRTMNFWLLCLIVGPLTFGIGYLVWFHKMSSRVGDELDRRDIDYTFGASAFWLWDVLGALVLVGPFIYAHKLFTAMNLLIDDYNK